MNNPDTPPKPNDAEQPSPEGLDETACSAILDRIRFNDQFLDIVNGLYCDAPETSAEWRRLQWRDGGYSTQVTYGDLAHGMSDFAKKLERERNQAITERDALKCLIYAISEKIGDDGQRGWEENILRRVKEICK